MAEKPFSRQVDDAVLALLAEDGFRRRGHILTAEVAPGVHARLGLNKATHGYRHAANVLPILALRHDAVERLVDDIDPDKQIHPGRPAPATVSDPIVSFLPSRNDPHFWLFEAETLAAQAADLVAVFRRYGLPVLRERSTLQGIAAWIEAGGGHPHMTRYSLPVIYLLMGDPAHALELVDRYIAEAEGRIDPAAVKYRAFAEAFRERVRTARSP